MGENIVKHIRLLYIVQLRHSTQPAGGSESPLCQKPKKLGGRTDIGYYVDAPARQRCQYLIEQAEVRYPVSGEAYCLHPAEIGSGGILPEMGHLPLI
jgi:hypothetical protein